MVFVRLFHLRLFVFVFSSSSWCLGRTAACNCGTPWTFLLPSFFQISKNTILLYWVLRFLIFSCFQGFNNAGLFSVATSWAFTVETTSPMKGYVNDGELKSDDSAFDLDYQMERSKLRAYWGGFTDPHTPIREYRVSAGTIKGAQDVLTTRAIGLVNSKYS